MALALKSPSCPATVPNKAQRQLAEMVAEAKALGTIVTAFPFAITLRMSLRRRRTVVGSVMVLCGASSSSVRSSFVVLAAFAKS